MMDIIYFGNGYEKDDPARYYEQEFIKEVKEFFPNVQLKNAYDEIKGYRQSVFLDDTQKDEYMSYLIGKGWVEFSLTFQIALMSEEKKNDIERRFKMAKEKYPEAFNPESL